MQPRLDALGIPLVAVAKERLGADEFVEKFWPAPLRMLFDLDAEKPFFRAINGGSLGVCGFVNYLFNGRVKANWQRAAAASFPMLGHEHIAHNNKGEGKLLGGLAVVAPGGELTALWREMVWGDHAPAADVLKAAELVAAPTAPARLASAAGEATDGWLLSSQAPEDALKAAAAGPGSSSAKVAPAAPGDDQA